MIMNAKMTKEGKRGWKYEDKSENDDVDEQFLKKV